MLSTISKQFSQCSCTWCGKGYKTRINLEKHTILCELIHKSSKKRANKNNDDYIFLERIVILFKF